MLSIKAAGIYNRDIDDIYNIMLLLAVARSNYRYFPRLFIRSRIEIETYNIQALYFLSFLSVALAPTAILL